MINLQDYSQPVPTNAVEIDAVVLDIQTKLSAGLSWLTHGHGKTYRNTDSSKGNVLYFPEVHLGGKEYLRVTPDNDKQGQNIILVGSENIEQFEEGGYSFLRYDLAVIFSANLETINKTLLGTEYFRQNLIKDVRHVLTRGLVGGGYKLDISEVVTDFEEVYSEFNIQDTRGISLAPFGHFRFNCSVLLREDCDAVLFNKCDTVWNMLSADEQCCILKKYDFSSDLSCLTAQQITDLTNLLCTGGCAGDFVTGTLAEAQRINYLAGETVCIDGTQYLATNLGNFNTNAGSLIGNATRVNNSKIYSYSIDGGNDGLGYIFSLDLDGSNFKIEYHFNSSDGNSPVGRLLFAEGCLYGTNTAGGANNVGNIFKYNLIEKQYYVVCGLSNATGFAMSAAANILNDHTSDTDPILIGTYLYEVFINGGTNGLGTVLKIDVSSGATTVIYNITAADRAGGRVNTNVIHLGSTVYASCCLAAFVIQPDDSFVKHIIGSINVNYIANMQFDENLNIIFYVGRSSAGGFPFMQVADICGGGFVLGAPIPVSSTTRYFQFGVYYNNTNYICAGTAGRVNMSIKDGSTLVYQGSATEPIKSNFQLFNNLLYITENQKITRVDLDTNTSVVVFDMALQTFNGVITDPINTLEINQAPIYLVKQP
jgi:hypothetical protein